MTSRLYREHDAASQTYFAEVKQLARSQQQLLSGTPGTLKQRTKHGRQYWVREYIRPDGKKTDQHLGSVETTATETADGVARDIELAKALAASSARLRLLGYQRVDKKVAAVLGLFFSKRLFEGGLTLVGSHAYGALLNELGIIAPPYKAQDADVARARRPALALPPGSTFQSMLRETGLNFVPIPGMPSKRPSTSFKLPGAETLAVDLLVPGDKAGDAILVPEFETHAQAIPLLEFLTDDRIETVALSPNHVIPINTPSPERFALHKIYSSQSRRTSDRGKIRKDLEQAAVLAAAIEEETPGRLADAFRAMPKKGKAAVSRGASVAIKLLGKSHEEAREALGRLTAR